MKERFAFRFDNLGLDLNMNGKTVLKGVSGEFSHSQLIAIMGPSGAVNDGNAYMLGGIAGHAGLFSTVVDVSLLLNELMFNNRIIIPKVCD